MNVFATAFGALDLALFVFSKAEDEFEWLLAIFAIEFVAGHDDLRGTARGEGTLTKHVRRGEGGVKARVKSEGGEFQGP